VNTYSIGVERKKGDFIGDYYSGKLVQQLKELRECYDHPFLLIEYDSIDKMISTFNVPEDTMIGMLSSVTAKHKVPFYLTGNYFAPFLVRIIYKTIQGIKQEGKSYTPIRQAPKQRRKATVSQWKIYRIETLPDVGPEMSARIYAHFKGSYKNMVNASIQDWTRIPGISDTTAIKIMKVLS